LAPLELATRPDVVSTASRLTASTLASLIADGDGQIVLLDVRGPSEVAGGAIEGSTAIPLAELADRVSEIDPSRPTVVYCASGYRSSVAASWLRSAGFADVSDLLGGYTAWSSRA
jgi:rhodanese-related sulfurtransferase